MFARGVRGGLGRSDDEDDKDATSNNKPVCAGEDGVDFARTT